MQLEVRRRLLPVLPPHSWLLIGPAGRHLFAPPRLLPGMKLHPRHLECIIETPGRRTYPCRRRNRPNYSVGAAAAGRAITTEPAGSRCIHGGQPEQSHSRFAASGHWQAGWQAGSLTHAWPWWSDGLGRLRVLCTGAAAAVSLPAAADSPPAGCPLPTHQRGAQAGEQGALCCTAIGPALHGLHCLS